MVCSLIHETVNTGTFSSIKLQDGIRPVNLAEYKFPDIND